MLSMQLVEAHSTPVLQDSPTTFVVEVFPGMLTHTLLSHVCVQHSEEDVQPSFSCLHEGVAPEPHVPPEVQSPLQHSKLSEQDSPDTRQA